MKLRLPHKFQAALMAALASVSFTTLSTGAAYAEETPLTFGADLGDVMYIGDSITHGIAAASWRWSMHKILVDAGVSYDENGYNVGNDPNFSGRLDPGTTYGGVAFENVHSAHSGGDAYEIIGRKQRSGGHYGNSNIYNWLGVDKQLTVRGSSTGTYTGTVTENVNTFMMLIGTNDMLSSGNNPAAIAGAASDALVQDISDIYGVMQSADPGSKLVLLSIPTWGTHNNNNTTESHQAVAAANAKIKTWADAQDNVTYVEVNTGLIDVSSTSIQLKGVDSFYRAPGTGGGSDGLHPNAQGELIIAGNVAKAMGYAGRSVGLERSSAATPGSVTWITPITEEATITAGAAAHVVEGVQFTTALGYTVDFSAVYGNGGTEGWDNANAFSIQVGDGTHSGTLSLTEAYVKWGDKILYSRDNSESGNFRIAYINTSINAADNVSAGYYVWLGDQLIGEALGAGSAGFSGISMQASGADATVSTLSWTDAAYAPTTTGYVNSAEAFKLVQLNPNPNHDNPTKQGIRTDITWTATTDKYALPSGQSSTETTIYKEISTTVGNNYTGAANANYTGDIGMRYAGDTDLQANHSVISVLNGTVSGNVYMQLDNPDTVYKSWTVNSPTSVIASYGGNITGSYTVVYNGGIFNAAVRGGTYQNHTIGEGSHSYVNGGTFKAGVYGGGVAGTINNGVTVTVTGGDITGGVYGGGIGGTINGGTIVTITGGNIKGGVHGGGNGGTVNGGTAVVIEGNLAHIEGDITADTVTLKDVAPSEQHYTDGFDYYSGSIRADKVVLNHYTVEQMLASVETKSLVLQGNSATTIHNLTLTACDIHVDEGSELTLDGVNTYGNTATYNGHVAIADNTTFNLSSAEMVSGGETHYSDGGDGYAMGAFYVLKQATDEDPVTGTGLYNTAGEALSSANTDTFTGGGILAGATFEYMTEGDNAGSLLAYGGGVGGDYFVNTADAVYSSTSTTYHAYDATSIRLNGGTLTFEDSLKEGTTITVGNAASGMNLAAGTSVKAAAISYAASVSGFALSGEGELILTAANAEQMLTTVTGDGTMRLTETAGLTGNKASVSNGTFIVGNGTGSQVTMTVGNSNSDTSSIASFNKVVLDNGKLSFHAATDTVATVKNLDVTSAGGYIYVDDVGDRNNNLIRLAGDTTLAGDLTLESNWKNHIVIDKPLGDGDLVIKGSEHTGSDTMVLTLKDASAWSGTLDYSPKSTGNVLKFAMGSGATASTDGSLKLAGNANMRVIMGTRNEDSFSITGANYIAFASTTLGSGSTLQTINTNSSVADGTANGIGLGDVTMLGNATINPVSANGTYIKMDSLSGTGTLTVNHGVASNYRTTLDLGGTDTTADFNGTIQLCFTSGIGNPRGIFLVLNDQYVAANAVVHFTSPVGNASHYMGLGINADLVKVAGLTEGTNVAGKNFYALYSGSAAGSGDVDTYKNNASTGGMRTLEITGSGNYTSGIKVLNNISLAMSGSGSQTFTGDMSQFNGSINVTNGTLNLTPAASSISTHDVHVGVNGALVVTATATDTSITANGTIYNDGSLTLTGNLVLNPANISAFEQLAGGPAPEYDGQGIYAGSGYLKTSAWYYLVKGGEFSTLNKGGVMDISGGTLVTGAGTAKDIVVTLDVPTTRTGTYYVNGTLNYDSTEMGGATAFSVAQEASLTGTYDQLNGKTIAGAGTVQVSLTGNATKQLTMHTESGALFSGTLVYAVDLSVGNHDSYVTLDNGFTGTVELRGRMNASAMNLGGASTLRIVGHRTSNPSGLWDGGSDVTLQTNLEITGDQKVEFYLDGNRTFTVGGNVNAGLAQQGKLDKRSTGKLVVNGTVNLTEFDIGGGSATFNGESRFGTYWITGGTTNFNANTTIATIGTDEGSIGATVTIAANTTVDVTNTINNNWGIGTMTVNGTLNVAGTYLFSTGDARNTVNGSGTININKLTSQNATNPAAFTGVTLNIGNGGIDGGRPVEFGTMTVGVREGSTAWTANNSNIWIVDNAVTTFQVGEGQKITLKGLHDGEGATVKVAGGGTLSLAGHNTDNAYTGSVNVADNSTLSVETNDAVLGTVTLQQGAVINTTNNNGGNMTDVSIGTLNVEGDASITKKDTWSTQMSIGVLNGTGDLLVDFGTDNNSASSVMKLTGAGDFSGEFTLSSDYKHNGVPGQEGNYWGYQYVTMLEVTNADALKHGVLNLVGYQGVNRQTGAAYNDNATLAINTDTMNVAGLKGNGYAYVYSGQATYSQANAPAGDGTVRTLAITTAQDASYDYAGGIGAKVNLEINGAGTQVLSGNNTGMTGGVTVNGGTLAAASTNALAGTGAVLVNNGGTLELASGLTNAIGGSLTLNEGATLTLAQENNFSVGGNLTLAANSILNLQALESHVFDYTKSITLGSVTGTIDQANLGSVVLDWNVDAARNATLGVDSGNLVITLSSLTQDLIWHGGSHNWSDQNWHTAEAPGTTVNFNEHDTVAFNGGTADTVTLTEDAHASRMTLANGGSTLTIKTDSHDLTVDNLVSPEAAANNLTRGSGAGTVTFNGEGTAYFGLLKIDASAGETVFNQHVVVTGNYGDYFKVNSNLTFNNGYEMTGSTSNSYALLIQNNATVTLGGTSNMPGKNIGVTTDTGKVVVLDGAVVTANKFLNSSNGSNGILEVQQGGTINLNQLYATTLNLGGTVNVSGTVGDSKIPTINATGGTATFSSNTLNIGTAITASGGVVSTIDNANATTTTVGNITVSGVNSGIHFTGHLTSNGSNYVNVGYSNDPQYQTAVFDQGFDYNGTSSNGYALLVGNANTVTLGGNSDWGSKTVGMAGTGKIVLLDDATATMGRVYNSSKASNNGTVELGNGSVFSITGTSADNRITGITNNGGTLNYANNLQVDGTVSGNGTIAYTGTEGRTLTLDNNSNVNGFTGTFANNGTGNLTISLPNNTAQALGFAIERGENAGYVDVTLNKSSQDYTISRTWEIRNMNQAVSNTLELVSGADVTVTGKLTTGRLWLGKTAQDADAVFTLSGADAELYYNSGSHTYPATVQGYGTFAVVDGATQTLGKLNASGQEFHGTLKADGDGSVLTLSGGIGSDVKLHASDNGRIVLTQAYTMGDNVTLDGGTVEVQNTLTLSSGFTGNGGTVQVNDTSSLVVNGTVDLSSSTLNQQGGSVTVNEGKRLTLGAAAITSAINSIGTVNFTQDITATGLAKEGDDVSYFVGADDAKTAGENHFDGQRTESSIRVVNGGTVNPGGHKVTQDSVAYTLNANGTATGVTAEADYTMFLQYEKDSVVQSSSITSTAAEHGEIMVSVSVDSAKLIVDSGVFGVGCADADIVIDNGGEVYGVTVIAGDNTYTGALNSLTGFTFFAKGGDSSLKLQNAQSTTDPYIANAGAVDFYGSQVSGSNVKINAAVSESGSLDTELYALDNARYTVEADMMVKHQNGNVTVNNHLKVNTVSTEMNTTGSLTLANGAATRDLRFVTAVNGDIEFRNMKAANSAGSDAQTKVGLQGMYIFANKTVSFYEAADPTVDASVAEVTIANGGVLQAQVGAKLEADLVMKAGSTMDVSQAQDSFGLELGCSLTIEPGAQLSEADLTAISGLTMENRWYFLDTSVEQLHITDSGDWDATRGQQLTFTDYSQFDLDASSVYTQLDSQRYAMVYNWAPAGTNVGTYTLAIYLIPEPTTSTLSLLALCALAARRRRK